MINFITGKINSFKTTRFIELYQKNLSGDGFAMLKRMEHDKVKSYHLLRLSTNEKHLFVVREDDLPSNFLVGCQIGPYVFNQEVLTLAINTFEQLIEKKISPLFLDEVGLLELKDLGFATIMEQIITSKLEAFVVVRSELLLKVVQKFQIKEYRIIQ